MLGTFGWNKNKKTKAMTNKFFFQISAFPVSRKYDKTTVETV